MNKIIFKLRIFGIATFLLYILSFIFSLPEGYWFDISEIRQVLMLVSFFVFAILILLQLYGLYLNMVSRNEKTDDEDALKS